MVCADRRSWRVDWIGRRRVPLARPDVRDRLQRTGCRSAESVDEHCHSNLCAGDPQTRDIPVIALSAHALAGEREKALAAGCNEFDTKRIEFDRLVATVRRILADLK